MAGVAGAGSGDGEGKGAGEDVAGRGAGGVGWDAGTGWAQAARARQIAAQRAAILGTYSFCLSPNKITANEAMAAKLGNVGGAPS